MATSTVSDIYEDLSWRGLIHQSTDPENLGRWLKEQSRTVYAGFDPTAESLHVGSLLPLVMLRRFQRAGHRPIALVGGATGMIGDPSGKSEERQLQDEESLARNVAGLREQIGRFLDFGAGGAILVNNYDWMRGMSFLNFLRDVGKHVTIGVMMAKDSVKSRLASEVGLSYTEFSYMLLQAYDFVVLAREYGCQLQFGGSDQWGNITAGLDLGRRLGVEQLYGLTCPLLTDSQGRKIGKTAEGTKIWLSAERTSPYAFYQYWINMGDADIVKLLRYLSERPRDEIEALEAVQAERASERPSQRALAEELTLLVHGEDGLERAKKATEILFGAEIDRVTDSELAEIFADVPSQQLARDVLSGEGLLLIDALVEASLAKSKGEARRTIEQGGAYINNRRQTELDRRLTAEDLASETVIVLRSGKKKYGLLRFSS
jgi:tyrosyl-tRNA synthetase